MSSTPSVQIQATFGDPQLSTLVSVFEGNLDLDQVVVKRTEYAVKAFTPFEFLITTASVYLLEKLVLAPLIDPLAEKFNWVNAVKKYLKPIQPFNLTINLTDANLILEAPLGTSHNITAEIWAVIKRTLEILEQENRLDKASRIRFTPSQTDELLIICYEGGKPKRLVNLGAGETVEIPEGQISDDEDTELSADDWLKQQLDKSERYRQFVAKFK